MLKRGQKHVAARTREHHWDSRAIKAASRSGQFVIPADTLEFCGILVMVLSEQGTDAYLQPNGQEFSGSAMSQQIAIAYK